jgi:phosphonate transport system ATP-binding protein
MSDPLLILDGVSVDYRTSAETDRNRQVDSAVEPASQPATEPSPALHGVSLVVEPGERVALIGPSGAGKSTLLSVAAGLVTISSGEASVLGLPTDQLGRRSQRQLRARIGYIPQDFALVGPLSVASNVAAGRLGRPRFLGAARTVLRPGPLEEIDQVLEQVGIADKVWDRADSLSGGEQQRTAIARTLFEQPDLVLADKPVSALDPARSEAVLSVLAEHAATGGRALVASMHDAELALRHCDRIVAIRHGRVWFDRPAGAVTAAMLAELYRLEAHATEPTHR